MTSRRSILRPISGALIGAVIVGMLTPSSSAQSCWTQAAPPGLGPSVRASHAMAYDSDRGVVVLFGGEVSPAVLGDTWEWDGNSWTQRVPATTSPPSRGRHAMAYDRAKGVVVLFGGWDGASFLNDTWEWDGNDWNQVCDQAPCVPPSARQNHTMVYDSACGVVVLYGGFGGGGAIGDTWEWDGGTWTQQFPAASPGTRHVHAMAYDSSRDVVVLYGGAHTEAMNTLGLKDTWEYDGTNWMQICDNCAPGPRIHHAMAYDGARGRSVLFGGVDGTNSCLQYSDAWAWDGSSWSVAAAAGTGPVARTSSVAVFEDCRARLVLFGGNHCTNPPAFPSEFQSDTWTLGLCQPCPWDLDGDGNVFVTDLLLLLGDFGSCNCSPADFDGDGCVGVPDLLALIANFGPCPGSECVWDVNGDGFVDNDDLQQVVANQGPCDGCPEDVDGDGVVDFEDVIAVATHFGPCP